MNSYEAMHEEILMQLCCAGTYYCITYKKFRISSCFKRNNDYFSDFEDRNGEIKFKTFVFSEISPYYPNPRLRLLQSINIIKMKYLVREYINAME